MRPGVVLRARLPDMLPDTLVRWDDGRTYGRDMAQFARIFRGPCAGSHGQPASKRAASQLQWQHSVPQNRVPTHYEKQPHRLVDDSAAPEQHTSKYMGSRTCSPLGAGKQNAGAVEAPHNRRRRLPPVGPNRPGACATAAPNQLCLGVRGRVVRGRRPLSRG